MTEDTMSDSDESVTATSAMRRPDPEDDPFACSLCGGYMSSRERLSESDCCDSCRREHGPDEYRNDRRRLR